VRKIRQKNSRKLTCGKRRATKTKNLRGLKKKIGGKVQRDREKDSDKSSFLVLFLDIWPMYCLHFYTCLGEFPEDQCCHFSQFYEDRFLDHFPEAKTVNLISRTAATSPDFASFFK